MLCAICLAVSLCGCNEKDRPPDYERSRTRLTVDAVRLIQQGQTEEAVEKLTLLHSLQESDPFPVAAKRHEEIRLSVKNANDLLGKAFHRMLMDYLEGMEAKGMASPELLEFRSMPSALEALQKYCSRMPWESSRDIQNEMDVMQPYLRILEQSECFRTFWNGQRAQLSELKEEEARRKLRTLLDGMDRACVGGTEDDWRRSWEAFQKVYPDNVFGRVSECRSSQEFRDVFQRMQTVLCGQEQFELAAAMSWETYSPKIRQAICELLKPSQETLTGAWLVACETHSRRRALDWLQAMQARQPVVPPNSRSMEALMDRLGLALRIDRDATWKTPCPGVGAILMQLSMIGHDETIPR